MLMSVGSKPSSYCIEEDPDLGRDLRRKGAVRYASGMEVEEMESMQEREWWRFRNGREEEEEAAGKIDEDEDDIGDQTEVGLERGVVEKDDDQKGSTGRFLTWNSSRIFRVRRGSGGKDRHSKVLTAKGLRDRRVRLSVSTAIQFYDLQDRLGYDQPSKAIEWLIKAAAHAIADLPSLDGLVFPSSPKRATDEKQLEQADPEADPTNYLQLRKQYQQQQLLSLSKSPSSSTSETSKGSVMTRSRSEIRVKARERARERTAKERLTDQESDDHIPQHNQNPSSTQSSFTDLLHGCGDFRHSSYMNYFGEGKTQLSTGFSCQPHSSLPLDAAGDHHSGYPQFSFLQDHLIPPAASAASTANGHGHNFSMSSTLAGFNRGTLQSNSTPSSFLPHLLKFSSPLVEASPNVPFFIGSSAAASTAAADNHQFLSSSFDGRLQHCYSDGCWHSDLKGKEKS